MRVIGIGAGGHAKVMIDLLKQMGGFELMGLLDQREPRQSAQRHGVLGVPVLGDDRLLPQLFQQGVQWAFIGVGSLKSTALRNRLYHHVRDLGFSLVSAIHPDAFVAESAQLGDGPTVMARAVVNSAASLGNDVVVNSGAVIEHDCQIGDHAHVAPGAVLGGGVVVDADAIVGLGATVNPGLRIGAGALVGAGAVVIRNVPAHSVVAGVPAKVIRQAPRPLMRICD